MTNKSDLGKFGENMACQYLVNKKYKILSRNFKKPWGEIDIIAKSPDKTLIFAEVKTVKKHEPQEIQPEEQITATKLKKIKKASSLYAGHYPELINQDKGWRIDLIAIIVDSKNCEIKHYKNIY